MVTDNLFNFNVLMLDNDQPDIQVWELQFDTQLHILIQKELGENATQIIVKNMNEESQGMCPYFRIIMKDMGAVAATNFKLQQFLERIRVTGLNAKCSKAMVVGLANLQYLEAAISVPYAFCTTNIDPIDFVLEQPELDLSCLNLCAERLHPPGSTLCDIAGLDLPYYVPDNVQALILSFCSSPTADIIREEAIDLRARWDRFLLPMFLQREPRIPANLALYYNAANVQNTIANATRPFLVPPAWENMIVSPSRRSL